MQKGALQVDESNLEKIKNMEEYKYKQRFRPFSAQADLIRKEVKFHRENIKDGDFSNKFYNQNNSPKKITNTTTEIKRPLSVRYPKKTEENKIENNEGNSSKIVNKIN